MLQEVVDFCKSHLLVNKEAFYDPRLELIINDARWLPSPRICFLLFLIFFNIIDANNLCLKKKLILNNFDRAELERREEVYDVIIGDLADPIEGGPCFQLYTKSFYEFIVKPRLSEGGIFVTQV